MVGTFRLQSIGDLIFHAVRGGVSGDFLEAGVCRGGTSIYARAAPDALGAERSTEYLCDSFAGLPPASTKRDCSKVSHPSGA